MDKITDDEIDHYFEAAAELTDRAFSRCGPTWVTSPRRRLTNALREPPTMPPVRMVSRQASSLVPHPGREPRRHGHGTPAVQEQKTA